MSESLCWHEDMIDFRHAHVTKTYRVVCLKCGRTSDGVKAAKVVW